MNYVVRLRILKLMATNATIRFFNDDVRVSLSNRTTLKKFIAELFRREKQPLTTLNYIFCSDEKLLQVNRDYLQHDYYTDIITFGLSAKQEPVEGEIYISIDRVKDNAGMQHTTMKEELHRVIFHRALHLCGYKDKSAKEKEKMTKAENKYLDLYFKKG